MELEKIKPKPNLAWELEGVKIQCPDCGSLFTLNEYGEYYCFRCKRVYTESEIRVRCGV